MSSRSATNTTHHLSRFLNRSEINYSKAEGGGPQRLEHFEQFGLDNSY